MSMAVSASMLYDYIQCPHRVWLDFYGDGDLRDPTTAFNRLLWDRGHAFEKELVDGLDVPYLDLRSAPNSERLGLTKDAMEAGEDLIYGGRLLVGDMLGEPDLLRKHGGGYVAGDIKSGAGFEGGSEDIGGKPKPHYAVQLAFYTDIIEQMGACGSRTPFVWDINGQEAPYDLDLPRGTRSPSTLWSDYSTVLAAVKAIVSRSSETTPAFCGACSNCHWRTLCDDDLEKKDDLTKIPGIARKKRDAFAPYCPTVRALADIDLDELIDGKKTVIPRVGIDSLRRFQARAQLQCAPDGQPYFEKAVSLPSVGVELFFDVETDPFRDYCYLHGFLERQVGSGGAERYVSFFADEPNPKAEERVFADAWSYVASHPAAAIYFYSHYERTTWRKLANRYSNVASEADVDAVFERELSIDLCKIVGSKMIWPTRNHGLKTVAKFLGFSWRDEDPSGAASIEWYHRWVDTSDDAVRSRILMYNEDDCVATRVLLDGLRALE